MSEITNNNPTIPTQKVAKVTFPKWVNQLGIIPTSYKDSMTFYETIAWLCKFLEEVVIPSVNENADAVLELQGLYVALKDYVDHYLDTQNFQELVDNKLDEMAEDGTLATIAAQYLEPIFNTYTNQLNIRVNQIEAKVDAVVDISPIPVASVDDMTDTTKIYLLTTTGKWYYYDITNSEWAIGGDYQATYIGEHAVTFASLSQDLQAELGKEESVLATPGALNALGQVIYSSTIPVTALGLRGDGLELKKGQILAVNVSITDSTLLTKVGQQGLAVIYKLDGNGDWEETLISYSGNNKVYYYLATEDVTIGFTTGETSEVIPSFLTGIRLYSLKALYEATQTQQEEIDELQDIAEIVYNALPTDTETGTDLLLENSVQGKFKDINISGNTSQNDFNYTYKCVGNESGTYYFTISSNSYYFTMPIIDEGDILVFNSNTTDLTLDDSPITITSGTSGTELTFNQAPNPDYPEDIKIVKGTNTILVQNKNLFDGEMELGILLASTGLPADNSNYIRCKNFIPVNELTNYKFSSNNENITSVFVYEYKKDFSYNLTQNKSVYNSGYLTTNKDTAYIKFRPNYQTSDTSIKFQMEKGTIATSYIAPQKQTLDIHLGLNELCKIEDSSDKIVGSKDNWKLRKETYKLILNGSENWFIANGDTANWSYRLTNSQFPKIFSTNYALCDHYKLISIGATNVNQGIMIINETNTRAIRIRYGNEDTTANFKTWLESNNVLIYYALETATETPITDSTLVADLNKLYDLKGYNEVTNVTTETENEQMILDVEFFTKIS